MEGGVVRQGDVEETRLFLLSPAEPPGSSVNPFAANRGLAFLRPRLAAVRHPAPMGQGCRPARPSRSVLPAGRPLLKAPCAGIYSDSRLQSRPFVFAHNRISCTATQPNCSRHCLMRAPTGRKRTILAAPAWRRRGAVPQTRSRAFCCDYVGQRAGLATLLPNVAAAAAAAVVAAAAVTLQRAIIGMRKAGRLSKGGRGKLNGPRARCEGVLTTTSQDINVQNTILFSCVQDVWRILAFFRK